MVEKISGAASNAVRNDEPELKKRRSKRRSRSHNTVLKINRMKPSQLKKFLLNVGLQREEVDNALAYYASNKGHMYGDCIKVLLRKKDRILPYIAEASLEESHRDPPDISAADLCEQREQPDASAES